MKLFLDHCVSRHTVEHLRDLGHDIVTAKELGQERAFDPDVLELATKTDRVMVTEDGDLGTLESILPASIKASSF